MKPFFAPSVFLTFEADQYGRIGIYPFYLYMMRMTSLTQVRRTLTHISSYNGGLR